jgi:hypothetical protein
LLRFSALAFYARIFRIRGNPSRPWVCGFYLCTAACIVWLVAVIIMDGAFSCNHMSDFWDNPDDNGTCIQDLGFLLAGTLGELATNVTVAFLPLPQVMGLNMKTSKKLAVCVTFILGYR